MTPKSSTRRLVVPRPRAMPYPARASRWGSELAFGPSFSGAGDSRPTPVSPPPTAQPGYEPAPSGPPTNLLAVCAERQPKEHVARVRPKISWEDSDNLAGKR